MNPQLASYWIEHLKLQPHPEGGYYKEIFRSEQQVLRLGSVEVKQACTSIYYLLEGVDYSGFHRLLSDEIWYFHKGVPLLIHSIDDNGRYSAIELSDSTSGNLSVVIPGGAWFAAEIPSKSGFTLASCAVAPGFDFSEFEMAKKEELTEIYPQHTGILNRLCR
ncbi:MAG TPA: cupin domain-containing protein [Mucilaginibacter sp.]|jgi:hypothetical protein